MHYTHPQIIARKPRGKKSPRLLPLMCYEFDNSTIVEPPYEGDTNIPSLGTVKLITKQGDWDYLEVTLLNGTVVPCFRRSSPDNSYGICQNFSYLAFIA